MKISVNILCWNNLKTLNETLKVLRYELKNDVHEIIVVDNGSTDGTAKFLAQCSKKNPNIKAVINQSNLGISKGKNQGIDKSTGDLIMLIDGDIIPIPNSINCLIEHMIFHNDCDAIGFLPNKFSNQMNKNGQKHHEETCEKLVDIHTHESHCIYYGLYRRHVFNVCRFCEDGEFGKPGYGWEDFDFYQQMKKAGIKQWVAGINHAGGKYYHAINSSIFHMGRDEFMRTVKIRKELYDQRWANVG